LPQSKILLVGSHKLCNRPSITHRFYVSAGQHSNVLHCDAFFAQMFIFFAVLHTNCDTMRYEFNVDGKNKYGQLSLSLAHLTETAICRYICYLSVDRSSGVLVVHSLSGIKRTMKARLKRRQCPASLDIFVVVTGQRAHATFKRIITVRTIKSPDKASSWRNYHFPSTRIHSNIRRVRRSQACQSLLCESQLQCLLGNYQTVN